MTARCITNSLNRAAALIVGIVAIIVGNTIAGLGSAIMFAGTALAALCELIK